MPVESGDRVAVLIDAHVHLHDCFPPAVFLDLAQRNFELAARKRAWSSALGVLMLTESEGVDAFGRLAERSGSALGNWSIEPTGDRGGLVARDGNRRIVIVAGRQVVTREGLEVLLLGTRASVPDGQAISEVLAEGARLGALRVIPWGVGKWLFRRGRLVSDIVANQPGADGFFLGDSGGRPFFWPAPAQFREAARRGIRVLGGTDPLPFPSQVGRPGSFGFRLESAMDPSNPVESIKTALRDPGSRLTPFGRLERALSFVRNQVALRIVKRKSRRE